MNNPIRTVIVDDEQQARDMLERLLNEIPGVEIMAKAENVQEGMKAIQKYTPELIFLDIEMPGADGFALVNELKSNQIHCDIIFVTAHNQYAIQAIKQAAFDYLLKPVDRNDLLQSIERYRQKRTDSSVVEKMDVLLEHLKGEKKIRLNTRAGFVLIDPAHILYCEADSNYTVIHLTNGVCETSSLNLGKLEVLFPDNFIRISRVHLINPSYLYKVNRKNRLCILDNDGEAILLPIPVRKLKHLEYLLEE